LVPKSGGPPKAERFRRRAAVEKLAATRSIERIAEVGSIPIPGSKTNVQFPPGALQT